MIINSWQIVSDVPSGTGFGQSERTRRVTVQIDTDSNYVDRFVLESHPGFPAVLSTHPADPTLWFIDYEVQSDSMSSIHNIIFYYSNRLANDPLQYGDNPLSRPARITRGTFRHTERVWVDLDGRPAQTTAGEPLYITHDFALPIFHITKNIAQPLKIVGGLFKRVEYTGPNRTTKYKEGIVPYSSMDFRNTDAVEIKGEIYQPGTLWATDFNESDLRFENNVPYYQLSYTIRLNPNGWWRKVLNAGYLGRIPKEINTNAGNGQTVTFDKDGDPIFPVERIKVGTPPAYPNTPIPLDAKGRVFQNDKKEILTSETGGLSPSQLVYLYFNIHNDIVFTGSLPLR